MKKLGTAQIKPQKNEYDDHFLDVVGNEFKFDHAKGIAEWIKNSADAYSTTTSVKDSDQYIVLRFRMANPKRNSIFECIDFVGMTKKDLTDAFKVWGLPTAAKKGTVKDTYGGHGNGGKFYMRQMFKTSQFVTYRDGRLNVFGFNPEKKYGFAQGFEDRPMTLEEAMKYAEIEMLDIPDVVLKRWRRDDKKAGFTVLQGFYPERFSGKSTVDGVLERLRLHPQARRLLAYKQVVYLAYGKKWGDQLTPPSLDPRDGFEKPREIPFPKKFVHNGDEYEFRSKEHPTGKLTLRTSNQPLSRGELAPLNSIDIMGTVGCIGSYRMNELGVFAADAEFIYGECACPMLEDKGLNLVKNDREKLVDSDMTQALLAWIGTQVKELAEEMSEKRKSEQKTHDLRQSSLFNQILDRWKNTFMTRLTSDLFGGAGIGDSIGGLGTGSDGGGRTLTGDSSKGDGKGDGAGATKQSSGDGGGKAGGAGDEPKKGPKFPRVLLSGHDRDPLDSAASEAFQCDPRQPPVYQRFQDINAGIYWINTSRLLAEKLIEEYGSNSTRWREYMFQRYVDIIVKQQVYELQKREVNLTADKVDNLIDEITSRVHDAASTDLEQFLFEDDLSGSTAVPEEVEA